MSTYKKLLWRTALRENNDVSSHSCIHKIYDIKQCPSNFLWQWKYQKNHKNYILNVFKRCDAEDRGRKNPAHFGRDIWKRIKGRRQRTAKLQDFSEIARNADTGSSTENISDIHLHKAKIFPLPFLCCFPCPLSFSFPNCCLFLARFLPTRYLKALPLSIPFPLFSAQHRVFEFRFYISF